MFKLFIGKCIFFGFVLWCFPSLSTHAAFYEVRGKVVWDDQPLQKVQVYLLRNSYDVVKERFDLDRKNIEVSHKKFKHSYDLLVSRQLQLGQLTAKKELDKQRRRFIREFKTLINQHLVRKISVNKDGSIYINMGPDVVYYIVAIKKEKLFKIGKKFRFWTKKIYFTPGNVEKKKQFIFDESNVVEW
jgi:hypothetical protein